MYTMPTNNMRLIETSALTRIFGLHRKPFRIVDILQDQDFDIAMNSNPAFSFIPARFVLSHSGSEPFATSELGYEYGGGLPVCLLV